MELSAGDSVIFVFKNIIAYVDDGNGFYLAAL